MNMTTDREQRRFQKQLLRQLFDDYDPVYHDAFVSRYNDWESMQDTRAFEIARGVIESKMLTADMAGWIDVHLGVDRVIGVEAFAIVFDVTRKEANDIILSYLR